MANKFMDSIGTVCKKINWKGVVALGATLFATWSGYTTSGLNVELLKEEDPTNYEMLIKKILKSNMFDSKKTELIGMIERDCEPSYYTAIAAVVGSNMFDSKKLEAIRTIIGA